MSEHYRHLGIFSDWVAFARTQHSLYPKAIPGPPTQALIRETLGFCHTNENPLDAKPERQWQEGDLIGQEVSWSVGYGPRTRAYVFKPANVSGPLPAIIALHDHSDIKYYGKEKIADGPEGSLPVLRNFRQSLYGGRAYVNALAREGFVVLAHDVFLWGSRRFPFNTMMQMVGKPTTAMLEASPTHSSSSDEFESYNVAAHFHEHWASKYCNILGTSMAGVVAFEDRVALNYLLSRPDVDADRVGCIGLSGGGNRAALLNATHDRLSAVVIVGLMSTYDALLDHNMSHTWMLFPFGWARHGDWPDIAACRAPVPLLVQYDLQDHLFTETGMREAHARLQDHYASVGHPDAYSGQFYPGPHKFDLEMQSAAFGWFKRELLKAA
ncbi:MAG TPA: acyl-CoA thioester hydrolase/BAAT C-terminal domain-containing protein [Anaerolineales bacterium]|nr:acyl-CoA thioester hydrolase/BAAT C-terminal domain-containing protein [Anaerolineales bacterium]